MYQIYLNFSSSRERLKIEFLRIAIQHGNVCDFKRKKINAV